MKKTSYEEKNNKRNIQKKRHTTLSKNYKVLNGFLLFLIFAFSSILVTKNKTLSIETTRPTPIVTLHPLLVVPTITIIPTKVPTITLKPTPLTHAMVVGINDFCLSIPIILYHHIQPIAIAQKLGHSQLTVDSTIFDRQMNYVSASGYKTLSVDQLVFALLHHQTLSGKNIVITLDDGYDDSYDYAYPILKKYHLTANYMIPTGLIDNPGYTSRDKLREMSASGSIYLYNHTWSHADLSHATEQKMESEITTAGKQIEELTKTKSTIFTYPYGAFTSVTISILKKHDYIAGLSTMEGRLQCESYIMTLHRTHIGNAPLTAYGI